MKKQIVILLKQFGALVLACSLVTSCTDIGSFTSSGVRYDKTEHKIIGEATGIGALAGGVAGALIAENNDVNPWLGGLIGAGLGGAAGNAVGKSQAEKARAARLRNQQLSQLIAKAKENNARLIAFNRETDRRIAAIRAAEESQRRAMADAEIRRIEQAQRETNDMLARRQETMKKLSSSDRSKYQAQTRVLEEESKKLARHKSTLAQF